MDFLEQVQGAQSEIINRCLVEAEVMLAEEIRHVLAKTFHYDELLDGPFALEVGEPRRSLLLQNRTWIEIIIIFSQFRAVVEEEAVVHNCGDRHLLSFLGAKGALRGFSDGLESSKLPLERLGIRADLND